MAKEAEKSGEEKPRGPASPGLEGRAREERDAAELALKRCLADLDWRGAIVAALDAGKPLFVACGLVGMSVQTVKRGAAKDADFADQLRKAEARRRSRLLERLADGVEWYPGEWKKTAWLLERTTPEMREVKETRQQVASELWATVDALEELMSEGAYKELLDGLAELERQQAVAPPEAPRALGPGAED
jgi:hypothetical protein